MVELLRLLTTSLAFLVAPGRYRIVDSRSSSRFGGDGTVTLESESVRIQLVRDRTEMSLRFQPTVGSADEWFWLGIARRVIAGDRPGSDHIDGSAVAFLEEHLAGIEESMADSASRARLTRELFKGREERAKELFG